MNKLLKQKKNTKKGKSIKPRKKRSSSESTSNSDIEKYTVDTDESEYGSMDDYIAACLQEEQENVQPTIPFGISEIEYIPEDSNKLKEDSWILARFVTKKSEKHFLGKVLAIKDKIPQVKFVRKVRESKYNTGVVFSYPRVDDICTMKHLDDVLLILP